MAYKQISPIIVAEGGTGAQTLGASQILIGSGTSAITSTSNATIDTGTGAITLNSGTGALSLSTDSSAATVNIGTGSAIKTVTLGSTNSTSSTSINFGGSSGSTLSTYISSTSFTPALSFGGGTTGITYSTQSGVWTRVGSLVMVTVRIVLTNKGSSTGTAAISMGGAGLPSLSVSGGATNATYRISGITFTGEVQGYYSGQLNIEQNNAGTITALSNTNFSNTSDIMASITYVTS